MNDIFDLFEKIVGEMKFRGMKVISLENVTEKLSVVKRGSQWCVVHGHPKKAGSKTDKPKGAIIKCFPTKSEADRMHKAIIISKIKRGEMKDV